MRLILSWLILSVAVWATAAVLPGFRVKDFKSAVIVAALFGLLNFVLGWLLFAVFTVATLGLAWLFGFLTRWLINALLLKLTDHLTDHLTIDGMRWAFGGALMISIIATVVQWLLPGLP
jgi:putative membrane protein